MDLSERMAIGSISLFFGGRMGRTRIDKILSSLGISDIPEGNKSQKIAHTLTSLYSSDKKGFIQFMNILLDIHDISEDEVNEVSSILLDLGHRIDNRKVQETGKKEIIYPEPRPFDAYVDIEKIVSSADQEIKIIDAYVDKSLFTLYLADVDPSVEIKIATKNMYDRFREVATRFKIQKPNFHVKTHPEIHDRYIIIDNRAWILGQSIKDAGKKTITHC